MDWISLKEKAVPFLNQYKYVLAVVLIGLIMMAIPGKEEAAPETMAQPSLSEPGMQEQLEEILSHIKGAGKVKVLLAVSSGEKTLYETNEDSSDSSGSYSHRQETVLITNEEHAQNGLVKQVIPPVFQGAVVVCQGGDQPTICLAIVEAVADATGLTADKITVLKMK